MLLQGLMGVQETGAGAIVMFCNWFGALNWCGRRDDPEEQPHEQGIKKEHGFKLHHGPIVCV